MLPQLQVVTGYQYPSLNGVDFRTTVKASFIDEQPCATSLVFEEYRMWEHKSGHPTGNSKSEGER